jgi:hypothetical protein
MAQSLPLKPSVQTSRRRPSRRSRALVRPRRPQTISDSSREFGSLGWLSLLVLALLGLGAYADLAETFIILLMFFSLISVAMLAALYVAFSLLHAVFAVRWGIPGTILGWVCYGLLVWFGVNSSSYLAYKMLVYHGKAKQEAARCNETPKSTPAPPPQPEAPRMIASGSGPDTGK